MKESKTICCPKCGRKVATWDGKSEINIIVNCRACHKRVIYNTSSDKTKITDIPQRNQSSGMRFY